MSDRAIEYIDRLAAARKSIVGTVAWHPEGTPGDAVAFRATLAIAGDDTDGLLLCGRAAATGPTPWMQISLCRQKMTIDRLSFLPSKPHTNKRAAWSPVELHLLRLPPKVTRRYAWSDNRHFPFEVQWQMARVVTPVLADRSAALRYMLSAAAIDGIVPVPEHQATLFP